MSYSIVYKRLLKETHFINSYNDSGSNKSGSDKSGSDKSGSDKSGSDKSVSNKSVSDKSGSNKYIINYKLITLKDGYSFKLKFYDSTILNSSYLCVVDIIYPLSYPFKPPSKILINSINIFEHYKKIITTYPFLIKSCPCCESLLCSFNWRNSYTITNIIQEIEKVIRLKQFWIKKLYLDKIIDRYSNNQTMDYLYEYLLT